MLKNLNAGCGYYQLRWSYLLTAIPTKNPWISVRNRQTLGAHPCSILPMDKHGRIVGPLVFTGYSPTPKEPEMESCFP